MTSCGYEVNYLSKQAVCAGDQTAQFTLLLAPGIVLYTPRTVYMTALTIAWIATYSDFRSTSISAIWRH